jgi:hypothetical protein
MLTFIKDHQWKVLFALWVVQGLAALIWLFLIPTDTENSIFLGFSPARLALLGAAFVLIIVSGVLFHYDKLPLKNWFDVDSHAGLWDLVYVSSWFIFHVSPALIFVLHAIQGGPQYAAYAERLTPLALWFSLSSLELIVLMVSIRFTKRQGMINQLKPVLKLLIFILLILFLIGAVVVFTGVGITPDKNMGEPATPVFEWQIFLIILALIIFAFLPERIRSLFPRWAALGIYVFTVALWLSQSVNTAYTATPLRAPNFEIYPFSDPQIYSQYSQSALIGNGFLYPDVPSRPLYIAFLTWFQLLGGQEYNQVVVFQTLLLAFFPVLLYLIGRELGGPALGFAIAAMAAFRDINANIAVPFASNVTTRSCFSQSFH